MPSKITAEQALHFAESLARGTSAAGDIARTVLRDRIRELL